MRPRRLEMRGFTAFRDQTEIDFSDLDLFALWGPMGSGKSSVLDALTYALYGKVERIGVSTSQLVSQGQPRMSVLLEFDVADQCYRITRSTPTKGNTKVLLERYDGTEWRTFGEGADRAREVNKALTDLIGLDYPAFTRAVLLPQGKFAEFLTGDAADRRKILTELLGLELFGRMAGIARHTADEAKADANARMSLIEQYADVDASALERARGDAKAATGTAADARAIGNDIKTLGKRGEALDRDIASLGDCEDEATELAERLDGAAARLAEIAVVVDESNFRVAAAKKSEAAAQKELDKAIAAEKRYEKAAGSLESLLDTRILVASHTQAVEELAATETSEKEAAVAVEEALSIATASSEKATEAAAAAETATSVVTELEHEFAHAQRTDLVGTLTHGLKPGAPCPVCEKPLVSIPKADTRALKNAEKALDGARAAAAKALDVRTKAEIDAGHATAGVKNAQEQLAKCGAERKRRADAVARVEKTISTAFGGKLPPDPAAQIEASITKLKGLTTERESAEKALKEASLGVAEIEKEMTASRIELGKAKATLQATPIEACVKRALKVDPEVTAIAGLPDDLPDDARTLSEVALTAAGSLRSLSNDIGDRRKTRSEEASFLLDKALEKMAPVLSADVVIPSTGLSDLLAAVDAIADDLQKAAIRAGETVRSIESDLAKKAALEKEALEKRATEATYRSLGKELSGNHIVDYLQSEALAALAAAGSDRLSYLSGGRYRLAYVDDEFFVVDGWNGDEARSVKTLSGGETFLASLALALALSDEVRNLAVTDKAPIESLFLDEGFGSLDAETLDTVVSAIEQLGGDERMVGVITHVADVADRLPVKLVVTKSPRGSHIDREVRGGLELVG